MRVALCSAGELFGGVERQLLGLCVYARRHGVQPLLILFHDAALASQAREAGVEPLILKGWHRYDWGLARQLAAIIANQHVDVLHVHGYKAMIAAALAARLRPDRPADDRSRRRSAAAIVKTEHGRAEPVRGHPVRWIKSRLNRALEGWATRRAAAVVVYVTEDMMACYETAHRGLTREVIHNGIDPLDVSQHARPAELEPGPVHFGIVGRVTDVKGIPFALDAMACADVPASVRLNVIGEGPAEAALRRQVNALGLTERVRFLGFRRDVYAYLSHLDVLLMPSVHEGLPYTLLEAMSFGVSVIASRVGGLAEVLRDGETGVLVRAGDVFQLKEAMVRLATDAGWRSRLGGAAAAEQRARYTLDAMGDRYWRAYTQALGSLPGGPPDA